MLARFKFLRDVHLRTFTLCNRYGWIIAYFIFSFLFIILLKEKANAIDLAPLPLPSAKNLAIDFRDKFLALANEQMKYMIPAIGFALIIRKLSG